VLVGRKDERRILAYYQAVTGEVFVHGCTGVNTSGRRHDLDGPIVKQVEYMLCNEVRLSLSNSTAVDK
jgi:hypothetical protein